MNLLPPVGRILGRMMRALWMLLTGVPDFLVYIYEEIRNADKDVGWTESQTGELAKVTLTQQEERVVQARRRFWKGVLRDGF